jgi:hypothetical protein
MVSHLYRVEIMPGFEELTERIFKQFLGRDSFVALF